MVQAGLCPLKSLTSNFYLSLGVREFNLALPSNGNLRSKIGKAKAWGSERPLSNAFSASPSGHVGKSMLTIRSTPTSMTARRPAVVAGRSMWELSGKLSVHFARTRVEEGDLL